MLEIVRITSVSTDRLLFQYVVQHGTLLQLLFEEGRQKRCVGFERTFRSAHVSLEIVRRRELVVKCADEFGIFAPAEFAGCHSVIHRVAVGDHTDHGVVDEAGVGVEVFVGRQLFLFGQLLTLLGIMRQFDRKGHHLEIKVIGLVDRIHHVLFRRDHIVRVGFEMRIQGLYRLDSKLSST